MIPLGGGLSPRSLRASARFGVLVGPEQPGYPGAGAVQQRADALARALVPRLACPGVALVTGPSGCGKSMLLTALEHMIPAAGRAPAPAALPDRPLADLDPAPLDDWLRTLARAGLAEASLLARTPRQLSDGQRARLCLAIGMARAQRLAQDPEGPGKATLIVDEFGSGLDRTTAHVVAFAAGKWARRAGVTLVAAAPDDDLLEPLGPDVLVRLALSGRAEILP